LTKVFDAYSEYYDLLYADKDYAQEAAYVAALINAQNSKAATILELGCGTGAHAEHLARLGFTVHGIDMSAGMLEKAALRQSSLADDVAARLSFSLGDVRTASTSSTYDVVISLFHVMSYQNSNMDIQNALNTAAAHLASGGVFIFDYWYGPAVLTEQPQKRVKRLENDSTKVTRIAEPVMHYEANIVEVNYSVRVEEKSSGQVTQLTEKHPMRFLFLPEIEKFAEENFRQPQHLDWLSHDSPPTHRSWSALSILVRS
jgi:SAM-dependent methyltransferase|tara:strand:- start:4333 stop:5106 length:774 start_codon:yes stop_codon:yes gene_type:complete